MQQESPYRKTQRFVSKTGRTEKKPKKQRSGGGIRDTPDTSSLGLWFAPDRYFPVARVYLRGCTWDEDGTQYLTPDCVTEKEFEHWINWLKDELDQVLEEGCKRFRRIEAARRDKKQPVSK